LGGVGSIALHHPDRVAAERLIAKSLAEIRQLEALFSLWVTAQVDDGMRRPGQHRAGHDG